MTLLQTAKAKSARAGHTTRAGIEARKRTIRAKAAKAGEAYEQDSISAIIAQWKRQRPNFDPQPMALFGALARAYLLTTPVIENLMARHGLARGMFDVLASLRRAGHPFRLAPSKLSKSLMLSGAGMTNRLDRLEHLGLIARLPEPTDRRSLQIELTPKGRKLVEKIAPELVRIMSEILSGFGKTNVEELTRLLMTLNLSLSERRLPRTR